MMDNHKDWNNRGVEDAPSSPRSTRVPSQVVTNGARPSSLKKLRSQRNKSGLAISENFYKQHMQLSRALNSKSSADNNSSKNSLGPMSMENSRRSMESSRQSLEQHHDDDVDEYQLDDDVDDQEFPYSRWTSIIDTIQTFRYHCGVFVNHKNAQFFVVYLIAINAIMMGIGTFDFVTDNPDVENIFELIDLIFLIIFTIELGMQFCFYGWRMILDGWLIFDTIIIIMSWSFSQVQIIRAFRIFRAFRLITRIKVLKNLVLALFGVMPRMFAIGLLLTLVSYIFAVMFTQLFKDLYEDGQTTENYFGRMDHTLFTLFQLMTLDNWADIARQVMDVHSWAWLPFITFVVITGFVVVNLIIAVICDAISALREEEKAKLHGTYEERESESGSSFVEDQDKVRDDPSAMGEDMGVQLDALEDQVDALARMQEQSLQALDQLTRQLQAQQRSSSVLLDAAGVSSPDAN